jgi:hypothetical protein
MTTTTPSSGYSLLRSKTFWTMVFQTGLNVAEAIVHPTTGQTLLPPGAMTAANTVLFALAALFHQWTGNSTTGSN